MTKHAASLPFDVIGPKWTQEQSAIHSEWLQALDKDPSDLLDGIPKGKLLLGKRFEYLIEFWLKNSPEFEVLHSNHIFQSKGRTVGEVDFLVDELATGRRLHIEVACKFYLSANNSPQWKYWVGPGQKDTLRLKMDKLVKQLSIFETNAGKEFLDEHKLGGIEPALLMKGYFFHHYQSLTSAKGPKGAERTYPSGWWLKERELGSFLSFQRDTFWMALPKKSWLAPYRGALDQAEIWNDYEAEREFADLLNKWRRPIMIVKVAKRENHWEELSRGFLVGNDWG